MEDMLLVGLELTSNACGIFAGKVMCVLKKNPRGSVKSRNSCALEYGYIGARTDTTHQTNIADTCGYL